MVSSVDWNENQEEAVEEDELWEQDWDDDALGDNFAQKLKAELQSRGDQQ